MDQPIIKHEQIARGADIVFEMSDEIQPWGNDEAILNAFVGDGNAAKTQKVSVSATSEPITMGTTDYSIRDEL